MTLTHETDETRNTRGGTRILQAFRLYYIAKLHVIAHGNINSIKMERSPMA
jgi:hypothetical protein